MKTTFFSVLLLLFAAQFVTAQTVEKKAAASKEVSTTQDLTMYKGTYSTKDNPDAIAIFDSGDKLMCKILGKASIALEQSGKNTFKSDKAGISLVFTGDAKGFVMTENGVAHTYTRS